MEQEVGERYDSAIRPLALTADRVHILIIPSDQPGVNRMMRSISRHCIPYIIHT
jgi:hypothetical protein